MGRSLEARCQARQLAELAVSIGIRLGLADVLAQREMEEERFPLV
jgi:hypothetical protein